VEDFLERKAKLRRKDNQTTMQLTNETQLSCDAFLSMMPILFRRRGYELEGCVLWLKGKKAQHLAYCLPALATLTINDLEKWFHAGAHLNAVFSYVVTQGRFCLEVKASIVPWETELVDGAELQKWLRSAALR
jgi:hypothetical protein